MTASGTPAPNAADPHAPAADARRSYKHTLNLPKTSFPMKADLLRNEPASLKRWAQMGLYDRLRRARAGSPRFLFHDGPPYANGSIHLGHMLNKSLKDFVVRATGMAGRDCPYIPGWDCHGLPIEHKVMTDLVESGKIQALQALPEETRRAAIRRECRRHAEKYIKVQGEQFRRMLTLADYAHPYLTMSPEYEGAVLEVLASLLEQGLVFRALKPVHWSGANETALAEAELEYEEREDPSVFVDFEARDADAVYDAFGLPPASQEEEGDGDDAAGGAARPARPAQRPCFMIWTTTPWTLPANLAIAVHPRVEYALVRVDGNVTVIARNLVERVTRAAGAEDVLVLATCPGERLVGLAYAHPFVDPSRGEGARAAGASGGGSTTGAAAPGAPARLFRIVAAEYVSLEDGTGLVHTAPGHGSEDYQTGQREGLPIYCPVRADETYDQTVPEWLRGLNIWKANPLIVRRLRESGHLFHEQTIRHSYPHDWRSKTPVIFRCTEQWFVSVDRVSPAHGRSLRDLALGAVGARPDGAGPGESVEFVPEWGRNRLRGMLETRPDWCISRQRAWGLPIPAFFMPDGTTFMTPASVRAVARRVREKGSDAWLTDSPADLLAGYRVGDDPAAPAALRDGSVPLSALRKGPDTLDVWFESGSSWNAVMRERSGGRDCPVDLYLEGSDQHRGWFQSSLLLALGVTGRPPYRAILTHGFMVDKEGRKLSKSKGDTIEALFERHGCDVLRWWVASLSYDGDIKVDEEFFVLAGESYRKVRNTLRFMLSNLSDFDPSAAPAPETPPTSLEAWVLGEFDRVAADAVEAYRRYDFRVVHSLLYDLCNRTLSAEYLGAVKDRLYCDRPDSPRRRRTQAALWTITDGLCRLLAPILPHTADEAYRSLWRTDPADTERCVHLLEFPARVGTPRDPAWDRAFEAREQALRALERAKTNPGVENPLDAQVDLPDPDGSLARLDPRDLADLLGVSRVALLPAPGEPVVRDLRGQPRCERSWKRDGTVRTRSDGGMLSDRDAEAVGVA